MQAISTMSDFARTQDKSIYGKTIFKQEPLTPVEALQASVQRLKSLTSTCRVPSCTKTVKETDLLCGEHLNMFCDELTARNAYISECCGAGTYGDYKICEECKENC